MKNKIITIATACVALVCTILIVTSPDALSFGLGKGIGFGDIKKAVEIGKKTKHAFEATDMTAEQEYYLGRSVSAKILGTCKLYEKPETVQYINRLGNMLAKASDRPELFNGYHFAILESDEINGLSAPGGFVFVTRGLLRCCDSEDAVAAVLAHEISHIVYKHGLRSIRTNRMAPVAGILIGEAASRAGAGQATSLLSTFSGSIDDISTQLINGKYSRETEDKADEHMLQILQRLGYDPAAFISVLQALAENAVAGKSKSGFSKSHPDPQWRTSRMQNRLTKSPAIPVKTTPERQQRFFTAMSGI